MEQSHFYTLIFFQLIIDPSQTKINQNQFKGSYPFRAVKAVYLGYKNQSFSNVI